MKAPDQSKISAHSFLVIPSQTFFDPCVEGLNTVLDAFVFSWLPMRQLRLVHSSSCPLQFHVTIYELWSSRHIVVDCFSIVTVEY